MARASMIGATAPAFGTASGESATATRFRSTTSTASTTLVVTSAVFAAFLQFWVVVWGVHVVLLDCLCLLDVSTIYRQ
ncbi:hypothetical protein B2J88_43510 [Rhodococcus sp. SRB_17]|nr:hypothetical protein [Rhodococcus sp. SRB_17]